MSFLGPVSYYYLTGNVSRVVKMTRSFVSLSQFNYILDIDSCIISAWKYIGDGAVTDIGGREERRELSNNLSATTPFFD